MRLTLAAALLAGVGCSVSQDGVPPPEDQLFYPSALLPDPGGEWLYVINSNSDLRYNGGTIAVIDLAKAEDDRRNGTWEVCPTIGDVGKGEPDPAICCWDRLDHHILICQDSRHIDERATMRIGSFASAIAVQTFTGAPEAGYEDETRRLLVAVRGNTSITVVDSRAPTTAGLAPRLSCSDEPPGDGELSSCDSAHRISTWDQYLDPAAEDPVEVRLPEEPYALAVDSAASVLLVGHLRGGQISLLDLWSAETRLPTLVGAFPSLFAEDTNGNRGVTSFTVPGAGPYFASREAFVTSRYLPVVASFTIAGAREPELEAQPRTTRTLAIIPTGHDFRTTLPGTEIRGIEFVQDTAGANRAFVLQRSPPALVEFDLAEDGGIIAPTQVIETCSSPTFLRKNPTTQRLYVVCGEGQIYVVDPLAGRLVAIIDTGRGAAGLEFGALPGAGNADQTRGYIVGFGLNNVSILDLAPGSPTENLVIQRIGFPRAAPK